MGKIGAISLATGKAKFATDEAEDNPKKPTRKTKDAPHKEKGNQRKKAGRGRPPLHTGNSSTNLNRFVFLIRFCC